MNNNVLFKYLLNTIETLFTNLNLNSSNTSFTVLYSTILYYFIIITICQIYLVFQLFFQLYIPLTVTDLIAPHRERVINMLWLYMYYSTTLLHDGKIWLWLQFNNIDYYSIYFGRRYDNIYLHFSDIFTLSNQTLNKLTPAKLLVHSI